MARRLALLCFFQHALGTASANSQRVYANAVFQTRVTHDLAYAQGLVGCTDTADTSTCNATAKTLTLDVYEPVGDDFPSSRPTVLIIHGGGFTGACIRYDAPLQMAIVQL